MTWTADRVWLAGAIIVAAGLVALILGWALLKAGKGPAPSMLVVSVALIAMAALIGALITDSDSAFAIASAGLGALAGAVSSTFTFQQRRDNDGDEQDGGDQ